MARREGSFNDAIHRRPSPARNAGCADELLINPTDGVVNEVETHAHAANGVVNELDAHAHSVDAVVDELEERRE